MDRRTPTTPCGPRASPLLRLTHLPPNPTKPTIANSPAVRYIRNGPHTATPHPTKAMRRRPTGEYEQLDDVGAARPTSVSRKRLRVELEGDENGPVNGEDGASSTGTATSCADRGSMTPPQPRRTKMAMPAPHEVFGPMDPGVFEIHRKNSKLVERLTTTNRPRGMQSKPERITQEEARMQYKSIPNIRSLTPRPTILNPKPTPALSAFKTPTRTPSKPAATQTTEDRPPSAIRPHKLQLPV